ncbi:hypothetical protein ES288_D07G211700v1 [Gossypium darwinii]|uniref:Uncharacterized protein n=1 Tax=Gossypium darwinii TaxID=34276 RepID=A0A5D2C356_GOSDA|nr:hypothetical protein ES288_D07G211700v1 [Gossypium darwinii]
MKDILAKALYISKKGDFNGSDGSLTGVPENVIDKWAFETRFVATEVGHLFLFEFHLLFGFPSRLSCPVQSVVLLSEAKANLLYCIRSSWLLSWYIKHIGILLVRCGTHIFQCQSSNRKNSPENLKNKNFMSLPFAIAIRAARLYTAWLCYRSYVVVVHARSFASSKQDEVHRQGSFRT